MSAEYNRGFVLAEYFGYLRCNPDTAGYNFWLNVLNNNPSSFRVMVCNFITSGEYQDRFGAVRTHNNSECSGSPVAEPEGAVRYRVCSVSALNVLDAPVQEQEVNL